MLQESPGRSPNLSKNRCRINIRRRQSGNFSMLRGNFNYKHIIDRVYNFKCNAKTQVGVTLNGLLINYVLLMPLNRDNLRQQSVFTRAVSIFTRAHSRFVVNEGLLKEKFQQLKLTYRLYTIQNGTPTFANCCVSFSCCSCVLIGTFIAEIKRHSSQIHAIFFLSILQVPFLQ